MSDADIPLVPCPKCGGAAVDLRGRVAWFSLEGRCVYRETADWTCATTGASARAVGGGRSITGLELFARSNLVRPAEAGDQQAGHGESPTPIGDSGTSWREMTMLYVLGPDRGVMAWWYHPNADAIAEKESEITPLLHAGEMLRRVTYEVKSVPVAPSAPHGEHPVPWTFGKRLDLALVDANGKDLMTAPCGACADLMSFEFRSDRIRAIVEASGEMEALFREQHDPLARRWTCGVPGAPVCVHHAPDGRPCWHHRVAAVLRAIDEAGT